MFREIEEKVNNFKKLNENVRRNFAEILLATMTCLYKLYSKLKAELVVDPSREQVCKSDFFSFLFFSFHSSLCHSNITHP
jgi:hypothetical protein